MFQCNPRPCTWTFPVFLWLMTPLLYGDDLSIDRDNLAYLAAQQTQIKGDPQYYYFKPGKRQHRPVSVQGECDTNPQATQRDSRVNLYSTAPGQGLVRADHPVTVKPRWITYPLYHCFLFEPCVRGYPENRTRMLTHALARPQPDLLIQDQVTGATKCRALYTENHQVSIENTRPLHEYFRFSSGPTVTDFLPRSWCWPYT